MSIENIKKNKQASAKYMCDEITHICKNLPKRDPGSEGEKLACEYMAEEMSKYAEDVKVEPFKVYPASFMGWIYITITCGLLALVSYFFVTMFAVVLLVIGIVPMLTQFIFYKRFTDPLYKEKTSHNVTAIRKCTGDVKRRIFFNGHPDATWEWSTNYKFGGIAFDAQVVLSVVGLLYVLAICIARWVSVGGLGGGIAEGAYLYMGLAALVFVPVWVYTYFLSNTKVVVDGANDNLTGCYIGIAILKALEENDIRFEHTEVGVILSGSEEAGLRGAKAWSEAHKNDYKDAETIIVAYDTIHESEVLQVNRRDLNGIVKSDEEATNLFVEAAKNVGVKFSVGTVPFGATDSAAFSQGGFRATGITGVNHVLQPYYHTRKDSWDNLNEKCIADCFEISVEALRLWDAKNGTPAAKIELIAEETVAPEEVEIAE